MKKHLTTLATYLLLNLNLYWLFTHYVFKQRVEAIIVCALVTTATALWRMEL